ncbi:MAG TPA: anthranilate phosphoribosyltransferase [Gemmatimonadaceae bacterium]|nr:anthranilate phosphoribosyltransferase [Gemmatimonadaceae bacterium]
MPSEPGNALELAIRRVAGGGSLSAAETGAAFDVIMRGDASPPQIAALLVALRVKGETPDEVAGGAQAMRRAMVRLATERPDELVDTCGTGGGRLVTFNISTAAALLVAGAGVRVAKHGNRSHTSACGSADVLETLGVRIDVPVERMNEMLRQAGIVFMFAPHMHPAMRHVGPIRRELAIPTVMNILGPLANPAGAGRQVIGAVDPGRQALLARALIALGTVHALVVHGEPGMDEISPLGITRVIEVRDGSLREWMLDPATYGLATRDAEELAGGSREANARMVTDVLSNGGPRGARAAVVLNAAAAFYVSGRAPTVEAGVELAREGLAASWGLEALERLRQAASAPGDDGA